MHPRNRRSPAPPLDLSRVKVLPLAKRRSLTKVEEILVAPESDPPICSPRVQDVVRECAQRLSQAREGGAPVLLIYGAHLLRNGAALILEQMMAQGWLTHLATNGAGSIHDWEYAFLGRSTESVEENVATGTFGTWDETGRNLHLALLAGGLQEEGYGRAFGRFIFEDGATFPSPRELEDQIRTDPTHPRTAARADLLQVMRRHGIPGGRLGLAHPWKRASILAQAFKHGVPATVHPGIGYDIIATHPMFNGAAIGRAGEQDFKQFAGTVAGLDGGVVLSIGSAIMGPQIFEKALSCVNNLRIQEAKPIIRNHAIYVVDLQDGGGWDWRQGEPPKTNPAYYLRFCKSFSRMGGTMEYCQSDNLAFLHNLFRSLPTPPAPLNPAP